MSIVQALSTVNKILVDKDFAAVGTINLDYRSLLHHYEDAVLLYKTESITEIQKDFEEIFSVSQEIFPSYDKKIAGIKN